MKFCKIGLLLLFTLAPFSLSAITPDSPPATPQPVSLVNLTAAPSSFVNNSVNAMSGDYIFSSQEYISSGPDPYMLGATNISSSEMKSSIGYSTDFQHLHLLKVFQPAGIEFKDPMSPKKNYTHLYIFEPFGGKILFRGSKHGKHLEPVLKDTGYTNSSQGIIDGKNHIKNWKVWWDSSTNEWHVITGNGATRIYGQRFRNKHKRKPGYYNYYFRDYHITEEKKPSGNRVFYSYDKEYRIEKIKTMSSDKSETLHWVTFEYAPDNSRVTVATSDALTYVYKLKKMKTRKGDERFFIDSIERPGRAAEKLEYGETTAFHNPRIERSGEEKGPYLKTKYYHRLGANDIGDFKPQISDPKRRKFLAGRVRLQKAPAGAGGDEIITHSYFYHRNDAGEIDCTTVVDPYGTKVRYFYDESTRLKRIEHEKDGKILMAECFVWGEEGKEQEGCLLARTLYDETNTIQLSYTYDYDSHFNVIQETLYGNFTGASKGAITLDSKGLPRKDSNVDRKVWHFTYSDDIYNLKLSEIDPLGNHTYFSYYKETNLLQSRFTCEGKSIRKREFFKYDHVGCLVKETVDDGTERERNNLKNVTYRAIKRIVPRRSCPHYGAAEEISEYYLELESKREILLRKTVNSFNSKGLVAKKKLYDEKARHVASSSFEYDQAHRLIYSKDPLDREQFFSYDPSGRLILKKGPRKDLEERYSYDAMGRLIAMHELHTNGLELTSRVEYDFIGRKCTTIDPQGNQTKYEYDSLNRVTKIILPATVLMTHELKSGVRSFRYKNLSTHVIETDERGYETEREYSATGKLLRERFPDGTERTVCYDLLDRPTMQREPNRLTSLTTYDYLGRALTVVQKLDHDILLRESKKYSTFFLLEETQTTGERTLYFYDAAGRKSRVQKIGDSHTPDRVTSYQRSDQPT